jgi:inhibitor of nuclear factor kappa-B kinase subunit alpha
MRKIARETGIGDWSVRNIAKKELGLHPYKLQKAQFLTDQNKATRLQRSKALIARVAGQNFEEILFTDEKIFTVESFHNHQNDRIWSLESPGSSAVVSHRQHPASLMVWAGICATGKTPLVFVEEGVKINKDVYLQRILLDVVEPWAIQHFGNRPWTFQQDSAPAHRARQVQDWCRDHFPSFISSEEWPPYSPDLNPMDYSVWSILEARACAKPHKSLGALRCSLEEQWAKISVDELRRISENFPKRLKMCIKAKGGIFE